MSELKLTIDQLKNYLGTGLKCHAPSIDADYRRDANVPVEFEMIGIVPDYLNIDCEALQIDVAIEEIKTICYRLSDLDKHIPELGFVPLKRLVNDKPEIDDTIEIEFKERKIKSISSFEVTDWIDYESGESRREHIITFYPYGNQGMTPFDFMTKLFQWHFWPFGDEYFEAGLVIDKLKINS